MERISTYFGLQLSHLIFSATEQLSVSKYKLSHAVGARVMLHHNIDTKVGLVNGAIGSMLSIAVHFVTVQFENTPSPCRIEKVKAGLW